MRDRILSEMRKNEAAEKRLREKLDLSKQRLRERLNELDGYADQVPCLERSADQLKKYVKLDT